MSDTLWIVRRANGSTVTTIKEEVARELHARDADSALSHRPFPSTVRTPHVASVDYTLVTDGTGVYTATHLPTGVSAQSDDQRDAYKQMLRALHDHLERKTETLVS
jgi:hypothetical protein